MREFHLKIKRYIISKLIVGKRRTGEIRASSKINGRENGSRKGRGAKTDRDCKTERVTESSQ